MTNLYTPPLLLSLAISASACSKPSTTSSVPTSPEPQTHSAEPTIIVKTDVSAIARESEGTQTLVTSFVQAGKVVKTIEAALITDGCESIETEVTTLAPGVAVAQLSCDNGDDFFWRSTLSLVLLADGLDSKILFQVKSWMATSHECYDMDIYGFKARGDNEIDVIRETLTQGKLELCKEGCESECEDEEERGTCEATCHTDCDENTEPEDLMEGQPPSCEPAALNVEVVKTIKY